MPTPRATLIVLADGARARFFESHGVNKGVVAAKMPDMTGARTPSRDIDADRPGRSWGAGGAGRHGMQPTTDAHEHVEAEFLREVAGAVESDLRKGRHDRVIVVAAPRALGSIRGFFGERTKAALRAEIDKDLVGADTSTIEKTLDNVLAV